MIKIPEVLLTLLKASSGEKQSDKLGIRAYDSLLGAVVLTKIKKTMDALQYILMRIFD